MAAIGNFLTRAIGLSPSTSVSVYHNASIYEDFLTHGDHPGNLQKFMKMCDSFMESEKIREVVLWEKGKYHLDSERERKKAFEIQRNSYKAEQVQKFTRRSSVVAAVVATVAGIVLKLARHPVLPSSLGNGLIGGGILFFLGSFYRFSQQLSKELKSEGLHALTTTDSPTVLLVNDCAKAHLAAAARDWVKRYQEGDAKEKAKIQAEAERLVRHKEAGLLDRLPSEYGKNSWLPRAKTPAGANIGAEEVIKAAERIMALAPAQQKNNSGRKRRQQQLQ